MEIKKICCIGAGFVGGPTMAVIAKKCPNVKVTVVDINKERIKAWNGPTDDLPIHEPGLKEIVDEVRNKNLFFSTEIDKHINDCDTIFMAVNTPTKKTGIGKGMATDLTFIEECTVRIAKSSKCPEKLIVEKSTAPIGTAKKIKNTLLKNNVKTNFSIVSNPEFLAEGTAIKDLLQPDRILIGGEKSASGEIAVTKLVNLYSSWIPKNKIITTNLWSSELSKLASNAFLAQRISSINSLSALCEASGADIQEVAKAVGADSRIGEKFLNSSVGFGGSCFKKDLLNLVYLCKFYGLEDASNYWNQVLVINDFQKDRFTNKIISELANYDNKSITMLGWAFKKNTNDSRESAAIYIAYKLLLNKINIKIYDPLVTKEKILNDLRHIFNENGINDDLCKHHLDRIKIFKNIDEAIKGSSVISVITEWDEFKDIKWENYEGESSKPTIIDGRNIIQKDRVKDLKLITLGKSQEIIDE